MTFGQWKETLFVIITLILECNSSCRKENHSQCHWSTLTWIRTTYTNLPVLQENVSTTAGTSTWIELYHTHEEDSRISRYWTRNLLKDIFESGGDIAAVTSLGEGNYRLSCDSQIFIWFTWCWCPFLLVIRSVIKLQIREQIVDVSVLWFMEEIVEIVAGEVVWATARVDVHILAVVITRLSRSWMCQCYRSRSRVDVIKVILQE